MRVLYRLKQVCCASKVCVKSFVASEARNALMYSGRDGFRVQSCMCEFVRFRSVLEEDVRLAVS